MSPRSASMARIVVQPGMSHQRRFARSRPCSVKGARARRSPRLSLLVGHAVSRLTVATTRCRGSGHVESLPFANRRLAHQGFGFLHTGRRTIVRGARQRRASDSWRSSGGERKHGVPPRSITTERRARSSPLSNVDTAQRKRSKVVQTTETDDPGRHHDTQHTLTLEPFAQETKPRFGFADRDEDDNLNSRTLGSVSVVRADRRESQASDVPARHRQVAYTHSRNVVETLNVGAHAITTHADQARSSPPDRARDRPCDEEHNQERDDPCDTSIFALSASESQINGAPGRTRSRERG